MLSYFNTNYLENLETQMCHDIIILLVDDDKRDYILTIQNLIFCSLLPRTSCVSIILAPIELDESLRMQFRLLCRF